jgi:hypothetical protein
MNPRLDQMWQSLDCRWSFAGWFRLAGAVFGRNFDPVDPDSVDVEWNRVNEWFVGIRSEICLALWAKFELQMTLNGSAAWISTPRGHKLGRERIRQRINTGLRQLRHPVRIRKFNNLVIGFYQHESTLHHHSANDREPAPPGFFFPPACANPKTVVRRKGHKASADEPQGTPEEKADYWRKISERASWLLSHQGLGPGTPQGG